MKLHLKDSAKSMISSTVFMCRVLALQNHKSRFVWKSSSIKYSFAIFVNVYTNMIN
jgi:hypothetical protein